MPSKTDTPSPNEEKPRVLTDEEAWAMLTKEGKLPHYAEKLFGAKNIQSLREIIKTPEILEVDMLLLTGELSEGDELDQYAMSLPNFNEVRVLFYVVIDEFIQWLKDKIPHYIGKTLDGNGEIRSYNKGIFDLLNAITELHVVSEFGDDNTPLFCKARIREFIIHLAQKLTHEILIFIDKMYNGKPNILAKRSLKNFFDRINYSPHADGFLEPHPGSTVLSAYVHFSNLGESKNYQQFLSELNNVEAEDSNSFADKLKEILNLCRFKKVLPFKKNIDKFSVIFSGDEDENCMRNRNIFPCRINIKINDKDTLIYLNSEKRIGIKIYNENTIPIDLDAATGELHYFNTPICISEYIGEEAYIKLKTKVYAWLLEYLRNKEEDIGYEDMTHLEAAEKIHSSRETLTALQEGTHQSVAEVIEPEPEEAKEKKFNLSLLGNLTGNEVMQALVRLLGEPLRIRGSHHIFQGRERDTFPIALHGTDIVGIGMLLKCIRKYQISPEEFHGAL